MPKPKKEDKASAAVKHEGEDDDHDDDEKGGPESSPSPSNAQLKQLIVKLVPQVDLNRTGVKQFTKRLAAELGGGSETLKNLQSRSNFIKETLSEVINAMDDEDDDDDDEPILQAVSKKKKSASTSRTSSSKGDGHKKPFKSNLATKAEMSEALSNFLGKGKMMARTEIVRELWDYIKLNKLQNPENKREIILDESMKQVFGVDSFTMFTMNKYIGAHVYPFKPVDLSVNTYTKRNKSGAAKRKKDNADGGDDDDSARGASDEDGPKKKKKKKRKAVGLQPPYRLSPALAAVVGKDILPRPQVISALWDYIKEHNLQDPKDKREIFCDDKLKEVMDGQHKITMFNMNKMLTPHLIEKLDRSQYVHEDKRKNNDSNEHHGDDDDDDEDDGNDDDLEHAEEVNEENAGVKVEDTEGNDEDDADTEKNVVVKQDVAV